jgi:rhodanese-related sulfurtransferase
MRLRSRGQLIAFAGSLRPLHAVRHLVATTCRLHPPAYEEERMAQQAKVAETDATEAARLPEAGEVLLLDVREDDEWRAGHAPLATHLPLGELDATALSDERPIIAVCRSGNRSGQAAQALLNAGRDARNLTGGMREWAARGLPVIASDGSAGDVL